MNPLPSLAQDQSEFNVIFVHSEIDDYGLTPTEFRVYAHLARRAGTSGAWPSADTIASICRMHRDTVFRCLTRLRQLNLVQVTKRHGYSNFYVLSPRSQWKPLTGVAANKGHPSNSSTPTRRKRRDTPHRNVRDGGVTESKGHEGYPSEGNPKNNAAAGPKSAAGRLAPAVFDEVGRRPGKGDPSIRKRAFHLTRHLGSFHWDNCKIRFAKYTAYSFIKRALESGHSPNHIINTYTQSLHHCHKTTTDEILNRRRHAQEKASPALTVHLANLLLETGIKTITEMLRTSPLKQPGDTKPGHHGKHQSNHESGPNISARQEQNRKPSTSPDQGKKRPSAHQDHAPMGDLFAVTSSAHRAPEGDQMEALPRGLHCEDLSVSLEIRNGGPATNLLETRQTDSPLNHSGRPKGPTLMESTLQPDWNDPANRKAAKGAIERWMTELGMVPEPSSEQATHEPSGIPGATRENQMQDSRLSATPGPTGPAGLRG